MRSTSANSALAASSQSVSASTALPRSQPSSKRRSAQASSPARGVRRDDEAAERAQRVLLLGGQQAVAGRAAQAAGERDRHPARCRRCAPRPSGRARARRRPTGAARSAAGAGGGRRPRARGRRRASSPARARRRWRAGRRRDPAGASASVVARTSAQALTERHLVGLDHEPLDRREHDGELAAAVGDLLELGVGGAEALGVEDEVGGVAPDRAEEGLQRAVGQGARVAGGHAAAALAQVAGQVGQLREALRRRPGRRAGGRACRSAGR